MAEPKPFDVRASELERASTPLVGGQDPFRLFVESVRDYAMFLLDSRGTIVSWNIGAERIKGYKAEEIIGQHFSRFYPSHDVENGKCERELEEAALHETFEDEGYRIRKDGSRFWANVIITALRNDQGSLIGFAKVTRDLTERRRAEQERIRIAQLEESNRNQQQFLEREQAARGAAEQARSSLAITLQSIGDAVIATDNHGLVTLMNPVAERLTGYEIATARGKHLNEIFRIVNEETLAVVESPVDAVLLHGAIVGLANHTVLIAKDGTRTPIADSGAPIRDGAGKIRGVILVFRDASRETRERKQRKFLADTTAMLTSSLEYRETLARVAHMAVPDVADWCAVDVIEKPETRPVRLATAHRDPAKVLYAKEIEARYPPDLNAPVGVPNVIRTGKSEFYADIPDELLVASTVDDEHLRIARELGLRSAIIVPLASSKRVFGALSLVFAESGRRYLQEDVAFLEEVGRRAASAIENARLYAAEQEARAAADAASRAKDDFLAAVSHELRTPLNSILGWATIISSTNEESKRAKAVETVQRNAKAMAQLIEDLLDVSRIISGKLRLELAPVSLATIVEQALESVRPSAEAKRIRISTSLDSQTEAVLGDPTRLQQVAWNLLSNAVKFTPQDGRVSVTLSQSDSHIELAVVDSGMGITREFLPNIFDPFRQADTGITRASRGLGLGLAIARNLVELHGGNIEAESAGKDCGATFIVRLPLPVMRLNSPAQEQQSLTTADSPPQLVGLRVMVVEDEDDARAFVVQFLEQWGCVVTSAATAQEAAALFQTDPPDVLLSDIGLPDMSGYDLIRHIRSFPAEAGGQVPAAALTAYARAEDRRKAFSTGYLLHIAKPVDPSELMTAVAALARYAAGPKR